jgi:hypothetical protein
MTMIQRRLIHYAMTSKVVVQIEQGSRGVVSPQQLHAAAIAMSKAVKEGKNEAETLDALVQSQQQVADAIASVEPRTAMRERKARSKTPRQVG